MRDFLPNQRLELELGVGLVVEIILAAPLVYSQVMEGDMAGTVVQEVEEMVVVVAAVEGGVTEAEAEVVATEEGAAMEAVEVDAEYYYVWNYTTTWIRTLGTRLRQNDFDCFRRREALLI